MEPEHVCSAKAAPRGSDFFYATLYADAERRRALHAVEALWRELEQSITGASDERVSRARLEWWRGELDATFAGRPNHPVGRALLRAAEHFNLAREYLDEMVEGVELDLRYTGYQAFEDLGLYCYRTGAVRWMLFAEIQGIGHPRVNKFAHDLGTGLRLLELLQDAGRNCGRGIIHFPASDMERAGIKPADLMAPQTTEAVRGFFALQGDRVTEQLDHALAHLPEPARHDQLVGLIAERLGRALLAEIADDGYAVLDRRIELNPLRKLWLAWRTMRREKRRARKTRTPRP